MEDIDKITDTLKKAIAEMQRNSMLESKTMDKMAKAVKEMAKASRDEVQNARKATAQINEFHKGMATATKEVKRSAAISKLEAQNLKQAAAQIEEFKKHLSAVNKEFKKTAPEVGLRSSARSSARSSTRLNNRSTGDLDDYYDKLQRRTGRMGSERNWKSNSYRGISNINRGLTSTVESVRSNRDSVKSLTSVIPVLTGIATVTKNTVLPALSGVGTAMATFGGLIPGIGPLIAGLGIALKFTADGLQKGGDAVIAAAAGFANFAINEVNSAISAYKQLGDAGAITSKTFAGMQKDAQSLGLSIESYSSLIRDSAEALASVGGSVITGISALQNITHASAAFEKQFLKLGIGFEQQRKLTTMFLGYQRINNQINLSDTVALSKASVNYIELLDELSRLTGKSKEKIAGELDASERQLRYGASLQIAQEKGTKAQLQRVEQIMSGFGSGFSEGFKDLFGGATTQKAIELQIATGGAAYDLGQALREGAITETEYITKIRDSIKAFRGSNAEAAINEERLGQLGVAYESLMPSMRVIANLTDEQISQMTEAKKTQSEVKNANDKSTIAIVDAQTNMRDFAIQIDKIVSENLFPMLAGSIKLVTSALVSGADTISKILGLNTLPPVLTTNPNPIGDKLRINPETAGWGAAAPKPGSEDKLKSIRDLIGKAESGGSYNVLVGGKKVDLTNMTVAEVLELQKRMRTDKTLGTGGNTPVGKYQIKNTTLTGLLNKLSIDPTTKFDEATQDKLANELILRQGKYNDYASGKITKDQFLMNLSKIWAGLPKDSKGVSAHDGVGNNKATVTYNDAMGSFADGGIASGPKSGYLSVMHGTEAVVPLPGGRNIPVEMPGFNDKLSAQLAATLENNKLVSELIRLMQSSVDTQQRIYRASM